MTAKMKLLRSTVTGHVPTALESGQVAINEADNKLFWRKSNGTIGSIDLTLALYATQTWATSQINAALAALVNAAPSTLDTLKELSDALGADASFATTMSTALGNRLRFDSAQTLTTEQKSTAVANLGLALGAMAALGIASQAEAEAGAVDNKGMTPLKTAQAIAARPSTKACDVQVFDATGTWTKPSGYSADAFAIIEGWGGGGGGGTGSGQWTQVAGGGGGAYNVARVPLSSLGATEAVTIAGGGAAATAGGDTTFGSWLTAKGGAGGSATDTQIIYALGGGSDGATAAAIYAAKYAYVDGAQADHRTIAAFFDGYFNGGSGVNLMDPNNGTPLRPGSSVWGGGAGGSSAYNAAATFVGLSREAGNGGTGGTTGGAGAIPSGGGGAKYGGSGGAGARGRLRITVYDGV